MQKKYVWFAVCNDVQLRANGYAAMAAINDVPGLETGEVYYIRNVITGRYLEVKWSRLERHPSYKQCRQSNICSAMEDY